MFFWSQRRDIQSLQNEIKNLKVELGISIDQIEKLKQQNYQLQIKVCEMEGKEYQRKQQAQKYDRLIQAKDEEINLRREKYEQFITITQAQRSQQVRLFELRIQELEEVKETLVKNCMKLQSSLLNKKVIQLQKILQQKILVENKISQLLDYMEDNQSQIYTTLIDRIQRAISKKQSEKMVFLQIFKSIEQTTTVQDNPQMPQNDTLIN